MRQFEIWTSVDSSSLVSSTDFCIRDENGASAGIFRSSSKDTSAFIREYGNMFCRSPIMEKTLKDISSIIKDTSEMPQSIYGRLEWNADALNKVKILARGDFSSDIRRTFFYDDGSKKKSFVSSDVSLTIEDEAHSINCDKFGEICQIDNENKYDIEEKLHTSLIFKYAGLMRDAILSISKDASYFSSMTDGQNALSSCDWYAKKLSLINKMAIIPIAEMKREFQDLISQEDEIRSHYSRET